MKRVSIDHGATFTTDCREVFEKVNPQHVFDSMDRETKYATADDIPDIYNTSIEQFLYRYLMNAKEDLIVRY